MKGLESETRFPLVPLKHVVNAMRPITYGIVQCGPDFEGGVRYVRPVDMDDEKGIKNPEALLRTDPEIAFDYRRSTVRTNDLVLSIGPSFGKVMVVPKELDGANLTQGTARVAPKSDHDSRFVFWALRSSFCKQQWEARVSGATFRALNLGPLGETLVPDPPHGEQQVIATFLDHKIERVDLLTRKKLEFIERLKEKRTALITRTITRGLPPAAARAASLPENPPLQPSGVPWFDEYPNHWQTKRLRHISDFIVVGVVVNPSSYVTDEGVVFLLGGNVREMRIDITNCKRCSVESSDGPLIKSRLDTGDIVVVRVGYPGVAAVVPPELAGGNVASMMLVRKHSRFSSQWLAYAFNSQVGRDQVEIVQYGAAQKQFNISHAVDFAFPFPPVPEQVAIAAYLDAETAKLDALVGKVEEAVERLQEYRTALITAAVTGKIDVRKDAAA